MQIYCDNSTFLEHRTHGREFMGIGCLLVEAGDLSTIVESALENLRADPDACKGRFARADSATLQRAYFHASEDSDNSHSWLCRSIRELFEGEFEYAYAELSNADRRRSALRVLARFAIFASSQREPVTIFVERDSLFNETTLTRLWNEVADQLEAGTFNHPAIPKFFPRAEIKIIGKDHPGIQIVDFLLWATNRTMFVPPDRKWLDRTRTSPHIHLSATGINDEQGGLVFGRPLRRGWSDWYPSEAFPIPEFEGFEHLVTLFEDILHRVVPSLNMKSFPDEHCHLFARKEAVVRSLVGTESILTPQIARQIASLYLRLFDTAPLFTEAERKDPQVMKRLLQTKRLAGLLSGRHLQAVFTRARLAKAFERSLVTSQTPQLPFAE